jgi:GT2 family glycosyltransferase
MTHDRTVARYSAVVLYFRLGDSFVSTLEGLLAQSVQAEEIVVVDNASDDGVITSIRDRFPDIRFVTCEANRGYAGGMNLGRASLLGSPDFVLFMTHEVQLALDCLETLMRAADSTTKPAQLGPVLHRTVSGQVWSSGGRLSPFGGASHRTLDTPSATTSWLDGACTLVRTSAIDRVGGWETRFFLYWEDVEYSLRLSDAGPIVCVAGARATQETGTTPVYYAARNRLMTWRIRRDPLRFSVAFVHTIGQIIIKDRLGFTSPHQLILRTRVQGLIDGVTGRLRTGNSNVRELGSK